MSIFDLFKLAIYGLIYIVASMKILRTMRLDLSDLNVFKNAAKPGEIAIPGSFAFSDCVYQDLTHKEKLAFQISWLGVESYGHSTLVQIDEADTEVLDDAIEKLAVHFVQNYGAPSIADALPVAQAELNYAISLCDHEIGTILAIERADSQSGIQERVRKIDPNGADMHKGLKIWDIVADE